jgi:hypothetical protein
MIAYEFNLKRTALMVSAAILVGVGSRGFEQEVKSEPTSALSSNAAINNQGSPEFSDTRGKFRTYGA